MPKKRFKKTIVKVEKKVENASRELILLASKGLNVKQITSFRKTSIQNTYRLLNRLIAKGMMRKVDTLIYITEKGLKFLAGSEKVEYPFIRVNNLKFKVKVLSQGDYFNKIPSVLIRKKYNYKKVPLRNNVQYSFNHQNIKIVATTKSFLFYMPNIYSKTAIEGFERALDMLLDIIPSIESMFNILLIKANYTKIDIISQEYALLRNELAKKYRIEKKHLFVYHHRDKKLRIVVDFSFQVDELELVHRKTGLEDAETTDKFFNDLLDNPITISKVRSEYYDAITKLTQQIELHLSVVKEIKETNVELKNLIKVLGEKI